MLLPIVLRRLFLSTTGGADLKHNKYVGQVSTNMRLITSKDSDLSSCLDKNGEKALNDKNVLKHKLMNIHNESIMNVYRITFVLGIPNVEFETMIENFKLISVVFNILIVLNI